MAIQQNLTSPTASVFLSPPTTALMVLDSRVLSEKGKSGTNSRQAHNGAASAGNLSRWLNPNSAELPIVHLKHNLKVFLTITV